MSRKKFKPTIAEIERLITANKGKVLKIEVNGDICTEVNGKTVNLMPSIKKWRKERATAHRASLEAGVPEGEK